MILVFVKCYNEWAIGGSIRIKMLVYMKHSLLVLFQSLGHTHHSFVTVYVTLKIILTSRLVTIAAIGCMPLPGSKCSCNFLFYTAPCKEFHICAFQAINFARCYWLSDYPFHLIMHIYCCCYAINLRILVGSNNFNSWNCYSL